jgi:hypothetical protein
MISPIESDAEDDDDTPYWAPYWDSHSDSSTGSEPFSEDDDYSIDSAAYGAIMEEDHENYYTEKEDKKYYLGSCAPESRFVIVAGNMGSAVLATPTLPTLQWENQHWILAGTITPAVFFRHRAIDVAQYLWLSSMFRRFHGPKIDILQLHISAEGVHHVIIKTFWLKLVQRTWRRVYRERQEIWKRRCSITALRTREVTGKYPVGLRTLPAWNLREKRFCFTS